MPGSRKTISANKIGVPLKNEINAISRRKRNGIFLTRKTKASHNKAASKIAGFPAVKPMSRVLLNAKSNNIAKTNMFTPS